MQKLLTKRWKLISLITFGIIAAGISGWYLLSNKDTATNQAATIQVSKGAIEVTVSGTGSVTPSVTKNIVSKVSGPISIINFKNGQKVKKGRLLFEVDDESLQNQIEKAELELKQAQIEYNASLADSKQQTTVSGPNGQGTTNNNTNKTASNKESLEIKLKLAKLNLSTLKDQLDNYKIYAPIDGVINLSSSLISGQKSASSGLTSSSNVSSSNTSEQTYLQVGDQVSNSTTLATIISNSGRNVTIPVDEVDITKVKIGQKVIITADALPDSKFNGSVKEIATEGTQSNGVATFDVTVAIDDWTGLRIGMTANIEIMVASKENALLLPIEAVQERGSRKFVILPSAGTPRQGMADMKVVETGLYNENMIEIKSGLREGDTVVLPSVIKTTSTNNQGGTTGGGPFGGSNNRSSGNRSGGMGFGGFGR